MRNLHEEGFLHHLASDIGPELGKLHGIDQSSSIGGPGAGSGPRAALDWPPECAPVASFSL